MRIVFAIHSLERGGAERVVSTMANHWVSAGHDIVIVTLAGEDLDAYELAPTVRRSALQLAGSAGSVWAKLRNNLHRFRALRGVVTRIQPDVVISFTTNVNCLTVLALLGTHIPVIISDRMDPDAIELGLLRKLLCNFAYPKALMLVVQTAYAKAIMQTRYPSLPIVVVPNPVASTDPDRQKIPVPLRSMLSIPDNVRLIAGMGRLGREKGFDLLISAFCRLAADYPDWQLVIFGEGRLRENLERQIAASGLVGRIHLPGVSNTPRAHLAQCDVFVMSSRHEGFPNVLLEAMACALPAVSFDCRTGPADIIRNGHNGILVPPENVDELERVLRELLGSAELRQKLGHNAVDVLQRFSMDKVMGFWDNLVTRPETVE